MMKMAMQGVQQRQTGDVACKTEDFLPRLVHFFFACNYVRNTWHVE